MLGICKRGYFEGELFDVEPGRDGAWLHYCSEHIIGLTPDDFDFDEGVVADYMIKHKNLGVYVPTNILVRIIEKTPKEDDWFWMDIMFEINYQWRNDGDKAHLEKALKNRGYEITKKVVNKKGDSIIYIS